jgi:3'-5' exoribonuclease
MPKIVELQDGMDITSYFSINNCSLKESRRGTMYVRLTMGDATGTITANMWRLTEPETYHDIQEQYNDISAAKVVKVKAMVESYNNSLQLNIDRIRPATETEIQEVICDLVAETPLDRDELQKELLSIINTFEDEDYKTLANHFFGNSEFMEKFASAPAAKSFHHAYVGGLLEHVTSMLKFADEYCKKNPSLRRDLLLCGVLFHDIGKMDELSISTSIDYTDKGSLIGHITMGVLMIEEALKNSPEFPIKKRDLLYHLILSHHGKREYGAPVLPAIPEAFALHFIDNLDAKVFAANKIINDDTNENTTWTDHSYMLESRIFKG